MNIACLIKGASDGTNRARPEPFQCLTANIGKGVFLFRDFHPGRTHKLPKKLGRALLVAREPGESVNPRLCRRRAEAPRRRKLAPRDLVAEVATGDLDAVVVGGASAAYGEDLAGDGASGGPRRKFLHAFSTRLPWRLLFAHPLIFRLGGGRFPTSSESFSQLLPCGQAKLARS